jgi:UDP-galactose transporter B1
MARSKLPPVKREASSEYFNKETASWEDTNGRAVSNGAAKGGKTTSAKPTPEAVVGTADDHGGAVLQLVIAVAGIYASL